MSFLTRVLDALFVTPEYLGRRGEQSVAGTLHWADFCGYHGIVLRNVYLPKPNGETSEIDLLFLTQKGIFVLESKNYSGYIFGRENSQNWTSTLYAGRGWLGQKRVEKHHFYNPIWQNRSHIRYLKQLVGNRVPMFSIIVFSDRCELKVIEVTSPNVVVCQQDQLLSWIRTAWSAAPDVLSEEEISRQSQLLLPLTSPSDAVRAQHIVDIRAKLSCTDTCPRCGGRLVLRTAGAGPHQGEQFYGCSNYPKCHYLRPL